MTPAMDTAGRSTHLKVVVVSLLCATVVAGLGLIARAGDMRAAQASSRIETTTGPAIRAAGPRTVTSNEQNTIR
jgi:hypothetical protein